MAGITRGMRGLYLAQRMRGAMSRVGGVLGRGAQQSVKQVQAVRRYADGRRIRQALSDIEMQEFEEQIIRQMANKQRVDSIRKLRAQILKLGVRGRTINKIVLERISLYIMPALEEVKRQIKYLPPEKEAEIIQNVMISVNASLRGNQTRLVKANIPTIDNFIKKSVDEIIYKTLPEQHQ